ncbi:four helix bundle protein [Gracilimonas sp.]|uniref:four helix bundle protein n=1 Tax=Gracilimonas sp. TaxID=1974203 RepID=UPI0037522BD6
MAEGYGRYHFQEGIQYYRISRGSLYELKDHLISCYDLKYVNRQILDKGLPLIEEAKKLVNGFINYQKRQKKNFKK